MRWNSFARTPLILAALVATTVTLADRGVRFPLAARPAASPASARVLPDDAILVPATPSARRIDGGPAGLSFHLDVDPAAVSRAFLVYELSGLPDWTAAPRSINGRRAQGGFLARAAGRAGFQVEEIQPLWLLRGANEVRFLPVAEEPAAPGRVADLHAPERLATLAVGRALPYEVRGAYLALVLEDGRPLVREPALHAPAPSRMAGMLVDGDPGTAWSGQSDPESPVPDTLELPLRRPSVPRALELTLTGRPAGVLRVEAVSRDGSAELVGEVDLAALAGGRGRIDLAAPRESAESVRLSWSRPAGSAGGISEIDLDAVPLRANAAPRLTLSSARPLAKGGAPAAAYLRGFVSPARDALGRAELFVDGIHVPGAIAPDGGLELYAPRRGPGRHGRWSLRLEVLYPGGDRLEKTVEIGPPDNGERDGKKKRPGSGSDSGSRHEATAKAGERTVIEFEGVTLDIPPGALSQDVTITIEALGADDVAAMDLGLTNVTAPALGYRFGPDGQRFLEPIEITLAFGRDKVPAGLTDDDVDLYFFDETAGFWVPLERVTVDAAAGTVTAWTDHFTDFVSAALTVPDSPSGENFQPDSLQALDTADPGAGITLIEPPEASPTGDARLTYPLELPPGRHGMEPELALSYDSRAGDGWLGLGWDLSASAIEVDTRFGVPRYDASRETETYALDGALLALEANRLEPVARTTDRTFHRRVEGEFQRIVRKGSGPSDYWWEVTGKDGVRHLYGRTREARLADLHGSGHVFRWYLEQTVDLHGNTVDYHYVTDADAPAGGGEPWVEVYLDRVDYTGVGGAGGYYRVDLVRDDGTGPAECQDPEGELRPDRLSSGLPGFKVYTRFRLTCVDVSAGGALVRRYRLHYREGDFGKTLLAAVALLGPDGASELARHEFDYFPMPVDAGDPEGGYDAFTQEDVWGRIASSDEATHSRDLSFGGHAFLGIGPPETCDPHVGIQVGGGGGDRATLLSFLDVNGDGLPDRLEGDDLFSGGGRLEVNRYDPATDSGGFTTAGLPGTGVLAHDFNLFFDFGAGGHALQDQAQLGVSWLWSHTFDDRLVSDVNGDGFPDLVSALGGFDVRLNERGERFTDPDSWDGYSLDGVDLDVPMQDDEVLGSFRPSDTLRKLVVPYGGTVRLSGAIEKKEAGGDDGVEVSIYHDRSRVWHRAFGPDDTGPCEPGEGDGCGGGLTLSVSSGDRLYFLADPVAETSGDALLWAPRVTYEGRDAGALEPFGSPVFVFDTGDDFRLAGPPGGAWSATAGGEVRVVGPLAKQATADDVTATVLKNGAPVWSRTFGAGEAGTFDEVPPVAVAVEDVLTFRLASDSQVDPARVAWTPTVTYDGGTYCRPPLRPGESETCGAVFCAPDPGSGEESCELSGDPDHLIPIEPEEVSRPAQVLTDVHRLLPLDAATVSWRAPSGGTFHFDLSWSGPDGRSAPTLLYVQKLHELVDKRSVAAGADAASYALDVALAQGEPVFFTAIGVFPGEGGSLTVKRPRGKDEEAESIPANVRHRRRFPFPFTECDILRGECDVLSGGFHHWYYGEWNGHESFDERGLTDRSEDRPKDYVAAIPRWQGGDEIAAPIWEAAGFDLYHAAEGVKPSRQGMNVVAELDRASNGGRGAGGGVSILRTGYGRTTQVEASAFGVGGSISQGLQATQIDFLDMNGDRFPDQVSEGHVRFSDGESGFGSLEAVPGLGSVLPCGDGTELDDADLVGSALDAALGVAGKLRCTKDGTADATIGVGVTFTKKDSRGEPKEVASTMPSVGVATSLSQTRVDLVDVNGDGLPDRVSLVPGAETATVQLNLGYRFGAPEAWSLPDWQDGGSCSDLLDLSPVLGALGKLDERNALSYTVTGVERAGIALGPIGGGVGTSLARTTVEMVDVNGDGLPDHVSKDPDERYFRVKLNLGDRWGAEQAWHVPAWSASLAPAGDRMNPVGLFRCLDSVSFSGAIDGSASIGAPICITIIPPVPILGIQIELSAQGSGSDGGLRLSFEDLDGDGFPDHVLKKSGDGNVYVKRSRVGKTNLLRHVARPLGGSFELDYRRQGNRVGAAPDGHRIDMPTSQWVLASVELEDGLPDAPQGGLPGTPVYRTTFDYGNDAFYDRRERIEYGYARILETRPDGSTIERFFHNQDLYRRELLAKTLLRDAGGDLFRAETTDYDLRPVAEGSAFPAAVREATFFYEGTTQAEAGFEKSTQTTYEYDSLGNVIRTTDFVDEGAGDDVLATLAYHVDAARYVVQPSVIEARDAAGHLLRRRHASYDAFGDLARLEQTLSGGRDPETGAAYTGDRNPVWTFGYDALGNLTSVVDPVGFARQIAYEPVARIHPEQVTDSFGYVTRFGTDLRFGLPSLTVDENGNATRRVYDPFGRLSQVFGPYDESGSPALAFEYAPGDFPPRALVHHKDVTRPDPIDSVTFVDGLERTLQVKRDAEVDLGSGSATRVGMKVTGRVEFDALGRVAAESQPVFDTGAAGSYVATPEKNPTRYAYDVLDRVTSVAYPQGATTRIGYGFGELDGVTRLVRTRTDAEGRATRFYRYVSEVVLAVAQSNTIGGARRQLVTRYSQDPLNQLVAVRDPGGNVTSIAYDTLGRRTLIDSPDAGRTEYRWDLGGNLGARITANLAARGQQIRYLYRFHRLETIDYPETPDVAYTYGAPGAPDGRADRVATIADESGVEERFYGKLGELVRTVKTATALGGNSPKGPYTTRFERDSFDRLLSMTYPDGEVVSYSYDAGGRVRALSGVLRGVRYDYLAHRGYDELGEPVREVYGNGVETRLSYDPKSRFVAVRRTTAASGRELQDLRYGYDRVGTLLGIDDDVPLPRPSQMGGPSHQSFRHDDLYQLVSAEGSYRYPPNKETTYRLDMAYDEVGNVVRKTQSHARVQPGGKAIPQKKTSYDWSYAYGGPRPHAATHVGGLTYSYDGDGNQTGWDDDRSGRRRTVTWTEEARVRSVADNGRTTRFLYDHDGNRSNKRGAGGETIYVNPYFSVRNGAIGSKHFWADGSRIASKTAQPSLNGSPAGPGPVEQKAYFYHPDHLGSAHFVTDASGEAYQHLEYFPSGELWVAERSESQRTPYLFTGKELDGQTGLVYFGARYYDPRQGRWLSPDPSFDRLLESERLEAPDLSVGPFHLDGLLYAYVGNTPLDRYDPNGLVNQIKQNRKRGRAFESSLRRRLKTAVRKQILLRFAEQVPVTVATGGGTVQTNLDFVVTTSKGKVLILEAKSSATAPRTRNQTIAFPIIKKTGFTSKRSGTVYGPTHVTVVRPVTLNRKGVLERILNK
jgi:RHS repeat-associated protein